MDLQAGTRIGPYEVCQPIGRGGMGEVYLATDTRLGRSVAIKALPDQFERDAERVARFGREARTLAALNHPQIAALYGVEVENGHTFLIMEYVEGVTLADRLDTAALEIERGLEVLRDIARAIESAHSHGIIHRDLKPANIHLTPQEEVKVLDFGLAKAVDGTDSSSIDPAHSPTLTAQFTEQGVILGTAAYMSPEQARGRSTDKRTDIWSFGCVLFECLAGRRAFVGDHPSEVIARILEREPDFEQLPSNTPPAIRTLLMRCLQKDPKRRLRDIGDALIELEDALTHRTWSNGQHGDDHDIPSRTRTATWIAAAAAMGLVMIAGWMARDLMNPPQPAGQPTRSVAALSMEFPDHTPIRDWALSPNGRTVAWFERNETQIGTERFLLAARDLNGFETRHLPGTTGVLDYHFSFDGKWTYFTNFYPGSSKPRLNRVPTDGSSPAVPLFEWKTWRSWSPMPDGRIAVIGSAQSRLLGFVDPATNDAPVMKQLISEDTRAGFRISQIFEHGRGALLNSFTWADQGYEEGIAVVDFDTHVVTQLFKNGDVPRYHSDGFITFTRGATLFAAPFDGETMTVTGPAQAMRDDIRTENAWENGIYYLSTNGTLAYAPGQQVGRQRQLVAVDRAGKMEPWGDGTRRAFESNIAVSTDGNKLAVVCTNVDANYEIWVADRPQGRLRAYGRMQRFDFCRPEWSPDGTRLAFMKESRSPEDGIYIGSAKAVPDAILVLGAKDDEVQVTNATYSWTPRNQLLISIKGNDGLTLLLADGDGTRAPQALHLPEIGPTPNDFACLSPNGTLLAFGSTDGGPLGTYVMRFGPNGPTGEAILVAERNAAKVRWSKNNDALYWTYQRTLFEARLHTTPDLRADPPTQLLDLRALGISESVETFLQFDVLPDGRFVFVKKGEDEADLRQLNIILDWASTLERNPR